MGLGGPCPGHWPHGAGGRGLLVLLLPRAVSVSLFQSEQLEKADGGDISQRHSSDGALHGLGSGVSIHMQVPAGAQVRKPGAEKPGPFACVDKGAVVQGSRESRGPGWVLPRGIQWRGKGVLPLSSVLAVNVM